MEKAAEKRKRREARKLGEEGGGDAPEVDDSEPLDPSDPYYLAKWFERQASQ